MRQHSVALCSPALLLFVLTGCQSRERGGATAPTALSPSGRPGRIFGTVALREGVVASQTLNVEVVVCRGDDLDVAVGTYPLGELRTSPVIFDFAVKWPNVPGQGQAVTWKASPPILSVFARGYVGGREVFIAGSRPYTPEESANGRSVSLTLVPVIE